MGAASCFCPWTEEQQGDSFPQWKWEWKSRRGRAARSSGSTSIDLLRVPTTTPPLPAASTRSTASPSQKPELNARLPDYSFDFKGATSHAQGIAQAQAQAQSQAQGQGANSNLNAQHRHKPSGSFSTIYGGRGRVWDPNTDVEVRRRDSQEVLARFMQGNLGRG